MALSFRKSAQVTDLEDTQEGGFGSVSLLCLAVCLSVPVSSDNLSVLMLFCLSVCLSVCLRVDLSVSVFAC